MQFGDLSTAINKGEIVTTYFYKTIPMKLLIIGASVLQLPAIRKAKEMGLEVAVADFNPNAIGIPYADHYFNASTIAIDAIVEVAKQYRPDGIMTLCTDMPMRSIAAATAALGLPGISMDTAIKATDKCEMIKAFKEHGVPSPWYFTIDDKKDLEAKRSLFSYPCIMKPSDSSGSRGVMLISSPDELDDAYTYSVEHSRDGKVIVEEYLQGSEVSVEVIVLNGKANILQVTDKLTTGAPNFVEMGHSQPSRFVGETLAQIHDVAARACAAVGITNGAAHVEMMATKDGPKMIELGARMGGDCITTHLVPLSTGIDMVEAVIDMALGQEPNLTRTLHCGSAIRYFSVPCGKIQGIYGVDEALSVPGVKEVTLTKSVGDEVTSIHSSTDRVGMVIAQAPTADEAIEICDNAKTRVKFDIELSSNC